MKIKSAILFLKIVTSNFIVHLAPKLLNLQKLIFVQGQVVLPEELFKIPVNDMLEPRLVNTIEINV